MELRIFLIIFSCFTYFSCTTRVNINAEKQAILAMHNAQRDYHFKKDSLAFVDQFSNNFISVNNGVVSKPSREESLQRFGSYFKTVDFLKWDDVTEPLVQISNDGSMAYSVVEKIVTMSYSDTLGQITEETTHFAWSAIYRKYGDEWKIDCVTSTNK